MVGIAAGLGLTALSVAHPPDFGVARLGAWTARPGIGTADADPYSKALMASRGEIPMAAAEGLSLTATSDASGYDLGGSCTYRISGSMPGANYWTLTVYRSDGTTSETEGLRSSFTSAEIIRFDGQPIDIALSAKAQPGNWLPIPPKQAFILVLRLYDMQISADIKALDLGSLPTVQREACQ